MHCSQKVDTFWTPRVFPNQNYYFQSLLGSAHIVLFMALKTRGATELPYICDK